ncbi:MAG: hypothetical protein J6T28_12810 [Paludibacteraceae bacterium]|nr:hypothetical protein [Paludibacteraceae bacterium]MBP5481480.1 hypothetical protein [Paludibacteraceae bacterium]
MSTKGGVISIVFSLIMSLIKGFGAKAIGIIVKGLVLGVLFSLVLTPLIFYWGEFSKLRLLISVVFFLAGIAGIVALYVLRRAPEIIDPSIDQAIASNYDFIQSKVGVISDKADPEKLFNSSKEFILGKFKILSLFLSGVTYEEFSKYAGTAAQIGGMFSGAVNTSYSYVSALANSDRSDQQTYLMTFLSPLKKLYRIPIDGLKSKIKLALILVPVLCLGIRIYMNFDLVKSWF